MKTWLTETFGLDVPIVGAPMFGVGGGALAAAVSRAGGLGMIGSGATTTADWMTDECAIASTSGRAYGVGLMAWVLSRDASTLDATIEACPALVSVSFGDIDDYIGPLQDAGIIVASQAGHLDEAKAAEQAGVDVIVARGAEAGGHGRNDVSTLVLLQEVLDAVSLPVLAAGGIATGRGLAAVLAAGAAGAWSGTAFLACVETATSEPAAAALIAATDIDTVYGRVFDVGQRLAWPPEFGGRSLRNAFFDTWDGHERDLADDETAIDQLAAAKSAGDFAAAYIYTGQGAGLITERTTAAEVVASFATAGDYLAAAGEQAAR